MVRLSDTRSPATIAAAWIGPNPQPAFPSVPNGSRNRSGSKPPMPPSGGPGPRAGKARAKRNQSRRTCRWPPLHPRSRSRRRPLQGAARAARSLTRGKPACSDDEGHQHGFRGDQRVHGGMPRQSSCPLGCGPGLCPRGCRPEHVPCLSCCLAGRRVLLKGALDIASCRRHRGCFPLSLGTQSAPRPHHRHVAESAYLHT